MGSEFLQIRTVLPIKECAALFQDAMRYNALKEFFGRGADFQKPPRDEAFGDLDDDPPHFEVMAVLGGMRSDLRKSGLTMYAWDRGDHTEIVVITGRAIFSAGLSAQRKVTRFLDALADADPAIEHTGAV